MWLNQGNTTCFRDYPHWRCQVKVHAYQAHLHVPRNFYFQPAVNKHDTVITLLKIMRSYCRSMSELQKHGQRHVKISNSTKDAGFLKTINTQNRSLWFWSLENRQKGSHSAGKEEKQRNLQDRSTWEREVLQKGTYVLPREELHALKNTYQAKLSINTIRELSKHIFNEDQEFNLNDHFKVSWDNNKLKSSLLSLSKSVADLSLTLWHQSFLAAVGVWAWDYPITLEDFTQKQKDLRLREVDLLLC